MRFDSQSVNITRTASSALALASAAALLSAGSAAANPPRNDYGSAEGPVEGSPLLVSPVRGEMSASMSAAARTGPTIIEWIQCQLDQIGKQTLVGCMSPSLSLGSLGS